MSQTRIVAFTLLALLIATPVWAAEEDTATELARGALIQEATELMNIFGSIARKSE